MLIDAHCCGLILIDTDWCWLMLIYSDWGWLMLIDADWFWERPESYTRRSAPASLWHLFLSWMVSHCLSCQKRFTLYFSSTCEVNTSHCYLAATSSTWEELGCNMQSTQVQKSSVQKMFGQKMQMCANMNMHICKIISTLLWLFDKLKEGKFTMEDGNPFVPLALVFTFFLHCGLFLLKLFK